MWREKLKEKMKKAGMSETQLAELCGISQPAISCYLRGTRTPNETMRKKIKENTGFDIEKEMIKDFKKLIKKRG